MPFHADEMPFRYNEMPSRQNEMPFRPHKKTNIMYINGHVISLTWLIVS